MEELQSESAQVLSHEIPPPFLIAFLLLDANFKAMWIFLQLKIFITLINCFILFYGALLQLFSCTCVFC